MLCNLELILLCVSLCFKNQFKHKLHMMASDLLLLLGTRDYLLVRCIILCRANDNTTLLACDGKTPEGLSMCCLAHLLNI